MQVKTNENLVFTRKTVPAVDADLVTAGGLYLDLHVTPQREQNGSKQEARFRARLGGSAANCGRYGAANGIPTAVIAVQQGGWASRYCRAVAAKYGLRLLFQKRKEGPAISLVTPNGKPGQNDIYTQRMGSPTVADLSQEMTDALSLAKAVIVGPMLCGEDARELLAHIPILAPKAFRALIPHRSLIGDPSFPHIARRYNYVQLNAAESRLLDGATSDLAVNARRLSFLIGEDNTCAVTNGADRGWLWTGHHWLGIEPRKVKAVDDTGCGDAFASAFVVGWRLLGLSVDGALVYATEAAASTATQVGVSTPVAYRK